MATNELQNTDKDFKEVTLVIDSFSPFIFAIVILNTQAIFATFFADDLRMPSVHGRVGIGLVTVPDMGGGHCQNSNAWFFSFNGSTAQVFNRFYRPTASTG